MNTIFFLSYFFGGIHAEVIYILNNKYLLEKAHTHTSRAGIMSVPRSSLKCLGLTVSQRLDPTIERCPMPYAH